MPAPTLVGVINLSPESPNADSVVTTEAALLAAAARHRELGAASIELGARSTSAHAPEVDEHTEQARLLPALHALHAAGYAVSVDTWSPATALVALDAGAAIINFLAAEVPVALRDAIAASGRALVLACMPYGDPYRMRTLPPRTPDLPALLDYFRAHIAALALPPAQLVLDPNLGVLHPQLRADRAAAARYRAHVLLHLHQLRALGHPLMVDHTRGDGPAAALVWAALLLDLRPDYIRTHDPALFRDLRAASPPAGVKP
jgi:dihydropteroate synthase